MSHVGRSVIVIGQCAGILQEGMYSIIASDKVVIRAVLPPNEYVDVGTFVQLTGTVSLEEVLTCIRINKISPGFDMDNYEKAIALANSAKYSALFNQ